MAISYAAVRNHHAKVTMPSIDGWYTSSNIQKDPPRSISTRRVDKVGDTMATNIMIEESPDRQCEAINYYARGVNPMVSVNYGQGQSGTQARLPYTVARDGAFRPPVLYGVTNLLPLSRLPRILTNVCTTPYQPIFTKRIRDCGTVEQTREVKSDLLRVSCEAQKAIQAEPDLNEPITALQIRDDMVYQNVKTFPNCPTNAEEIRQRLHQPPIYLTTNRPSCSATATSAAAIKTGRDFIEKYDTFVLNPNKPNSSATAMSAAAIKTGGDFIEKYDTLVLNPNKPNSSATATSAAAIKTGRDFIEKYDTLVLNPNKPNSSATATSAAAIKTGGDFIEKYDTLVLNPNKPNTDGYTNFSMSKESPVVFNNVYLESSRPYTTATTGLIAPGTGFSQPQEYKRLQERPSLGGFTGSRQIPRMLDNPVKRLTR